MISFIKRKNQTHVTLCKKVTTSFYLYLAILGLDSVGIIPFWASLK